MEFEGGAVKRFALVALASFCVDVIWTMTVIATSAHRTLQAATFSVLLVYVSGWVTIKYVETPRLLTAVALGSFVGTVVALSVLP